MPVVPFPLFMRRFVSLLLALFTVASAATAQVQFHKGDWASLLAAAKAQNKPFYVDFYTDWCGPCKVMTKNTFGNDEVGTFSNANYIAYKLNAEEGEGVKLSAQYQIEGYPTVIFFSADGKVKETLLGYYDPQNFMMAMRKHAPKRMGSATLNVGQQMPPTAEPKTLHPVSPSERANLSALFREPK